MTNPSLTLGDNQAAAYKKWVGFDVAGLQRPIKGPLSVESADPSIATAEVTPDGMGVVIRAARPPKLESTTVTVADTGYPNHPACVLDVTIAPEGEDVIAPDGVPEITELS